jgi:hypothetical protein
MALIRDRSRRTAPLKMLIFGLFLIGLQAYLAAGSGAAQFFIGFSLKKLMIQVPSGIVAVWIASRIFEFDFGTVGRIAQKIAAITVLAEGVACWIPVPVFSIIADLTVMLLGFFILFELSKWQTYLVVFLNFAVLFGAHYLLANYIDQPRPYGSRPSPGLANSEIGDSARRGRHLRGPDIDRPSEPVRYSGRETPRDPFRQIAACGQRQKQVFGGVSSCVASS